MKDKLDRRLGPGPVNCEKDTLKPRQKRKTVESWAYLAHALRH